MKNILHIASVPSGSGSAGAPPAKTGALPGDLAAENAALKARVTALETAKAVETAFEAKVASKVALGLNRNQAVAAVKHQEAFDASAYGQMMAKRHTARQARAPKAEFAV